MKGFFEKLMATGVALSMGISSLGFADYMDCCPPQTNNNCSAWCDNVSFSAAWLYWKLSGDEFDYVIEKQARGTSGSPSLTEYKQTVHSIGMDWDSGFRLGLSTVAPCYGWSADLYWTHFNTTKTKKTSLVGELTNTEGVGFGVPSLLYFEGTVPGGSSPQTYVFKGHEKFNYETIDLEFGKWCCCDCLSFRPHIGLRAADIKETFHFDGDYGSGITENSIPSETSSLVSNENHIKNTFKGVGVRAGLDTQLCLCDGWSIIGRAAAALVWGNTDLKQHYAEVAPNGSAMDGHTRDRYHSDRAFTDLSLGVRWQTCACGCYPIVLELAWEHHYLFNQHRYWADTRWNSPSSTVAVSSATRGNSGWKKNGDVALQGLTLSATFDF